MTKFEAFLCHYHISQHLGYGSGKIKEIDKIKNIKWDVMLTYAGNIIDMLRGTFGYKLEVEDMVKEGNDHYVCYIFIKCVREPTKTTKVPVVILETRFGTLDNKAMSRVLGYYCKSQNICGLSQQGFTMLFNKTETDFEVRIFLFPYCTGSVGDDLVGIQSLMLPLYKCTHHAFMKSSFLEFILLLANFEPRYLLKIPGSIPLIKPTKTLIVVIDGELWEELSKMEKEGDEVSKEQDEI